MERHDNKHLKPGFLAHAAAIEHAAHVGLTIYDFLAGDMRYKKQPVDGPHDRCCGRACSACACASWSRTACGTGRARGAARAPRHGSGRSRAVYHRRRDPEPDRVTERDAEEPHDDEPRSRWGTAFNLVMFVIGGAALAWMLRTTSLDELWRVVVGIGGWAGVVIVLDLTALCLDAAAWHAFMRPEARMVPYWRVLGAWASGRAINILTPTGALGEPTKVTMLLGHAPRSRVLSSLVVINVAMLYLAVSVMVIGIPITLLLVDLPPPVKLIVAVGLAVLVPAMVALGFADPPRRARDLDRAEPPRADHLRASARRAGRPGVHDVDQHIRELAPPSHLRDPRMGFLFLLAAKLVAVTCHDRC